MRVEHEPDNISDCNALKFEVLFNGHWFIIGYCGVKKNSQIKEGTVSSSSYFLGTVTFTKRITALAENDFFFFFFFLERS